MNGSLIVVDDVPGEFAERVIEAFHGRPHDGFAMALSGGGTARACYERLADDAGTQIDWWKVDVYWGDERCVPLDDPDSNYHLAREALLDRVGAANATFPMRCDEGADPYQLRIGELGRFDLVHLGLGPGRPHRLPVPRVGRPRRRPRPPGRAQRRPAGPQPPSPHDPDLRRHRPGPAGGRHRDGRRQARGAGPGRGRRRTCRPPASTPSG